MALSSWGVETLPSTNGTILNDGPNGYDSDGDYLLTISDKGDNDGDGLIDEDTCDDGSVSGIRNGKM